MNENLKWFIHEAPMWRQKVHFLWYFMHCLKNVQHPAWHVVQLTFWFLNHDEQVVYSSGCTTVCQGGICLYFTINYFLHCQHKLPLVYSLALLSSVGGQPWHFTSCLACFPVYDMIINLLCTHVKKCQAVLCQTWLLEALCIIRDPQLNWSIK